MSTGSAPSARRLIAPLWVGGLLVLLTFLVLYPLSMLIFGALSDSNPVVDGSASSNCADALREVLVNRLICFAALVACGGGTVFAVLIESFSVDRGAPTRVQAPSPA